MHLIILRFALEVQADHRDGFAGKLRQVNGSRNPVLRGCGGVFDSQFGDSVGIGLSIDVLCQNNAQAHGHIVGGGLLEGDVQLCAFLHIQVGLVQMHEVISIHSTIDSQRRAAVVGIHQIEIKFAVGEVGNLFASVPITVQRLLVVGAVVELALQSGAVCLKPELPGGQNVLNADVGPFVGVGYNAVNSINQTVTGIEIGVEGVAVDNRTLGHHAGDTGHLVVLNANFIVAGGRSVGGVAGGAGEPHTLADGAHPLEVVGFTAQIQVGAAVLVQTSVDKVGTQRRDGANDLAVGPHLGEVVVPAVAASFKAAVHSAHAVLRNFALGAGGAPAVILKEGVGRAGVHHLLINRAAGIVVLDVQAALFAQILQECSQFLLCSAGGRIGTFQVHKPAVEPIVVGDFNELVRIGETTVLISLDEGPPGLISAGQENAAQGQNAILVSSVGVGRVGQVHHAKLKGTLLPVGSALAFAFGIPQLKGGSGCGLAVPGSVVVDVLPEVEAVFAEFVGVGGAAEEGVAIVAGEGQILNFGIQLRFRLRRCNRVNTVLQRHPGTQQFRIGIGCGIPRQKILCTIAVRGGLVIRQGTLALIGQSVTGKRYGGEQGYHHGNCQGEGQQPLNIFRFHVFVLPSVFSVRVDPRIVMQGYKITSLYLKF